MEVWGDVIDFRPPVLFRQFMCSSEGLWLEEEGVGEGGGKGNGAALLVFTAQPTGTVI